MAFMGAPPAPRGRRGRQDVGDGEELQLCVYGTPATLFSFNMARDVEAEHLLSKWQFDEFTTLGAAAVSVSKCLFQPPQRPADATPTSDRSVCSFASQTASMSGTFSHPNTIPRLLNAAGATFPRRASRSSTGSDMASSPPPSAG